MFDVVNFLNFLEASLDSASFGYSPQALSHDVRSAGSTLGSYVS
jgi:hypothetical protein